MCFPCLLSKLPSISRYAPPKAPTHADIRPIFSLDDLYNPTPDKFAPPLSVAVQSGDRISPPAAHRDTVADNIINGQQTFVPVPAVESRTQAPTTTTTTSKYPRPNYSQTEVRYVGGAVVITEIGTVEDTPEDEVRRIMNGLGSRRRGLGRPQQKPTTKLPIRPNPVMSTTPPADEYDLYGDYYYYDY